MTDNDIVGKEIIDYLNTPPWKLDLQNLVRAINFLDQEIASRRKRLRLLVDEFNKKLGSSRNYVNDNQSLRQDADD